MLLTQAEAADFLRVSERSLERWRVAGTGPAFCKAGRRVLYPKQNLDDWIASHIVRSTSEAAFNGES